MIDFEPFYVNEVAKEVLKQFPSAEVVSEYIPKPSRFPHVYIRETDNASDPASFPLAGGEALARIAFTVDVHSNAASGRKSECRNVMAAVDTVMQRYGFRRAFCNPFPNQNDASIYRIAARYNKIQEENMEV